MTVGYAFNTLLLIQELKDRIQTVSYLILLAHTNKVDGVIIVELI